MWVHVPQDEPSGEPGTAHGRGSVRRWSVIEMVGALPPADRRSAFANAPMGIGLTTPEGVLVDANPALCAMVGRTPEELYGRSVLDIVQPDGVTAAREAYRSLVDAPTVPMRHETRLRRADGTDIPVQ